MTVSNEKQYSRANKIREKLLLFIDNEILSLKNKNKNSNSEYLNKFQAFNDYQNYKMTLEELFIDNTETQYYYSLSLNNNIYQNNKNSKNGFCSFLSILPLSNKENQSNKELKYLHSISKRILHNVTIPENIQKILIKKHNMQIVIDGLKDKSLNPKLNKRKNDGQYLKQLSFKLKGKRFGRKNSCLLFNSKLSNLKNDNTKKAKSNLKDDEVSKKKNNKDHIQMISKCSPRRIRTKIKIRTKIRDNNINENSIPHSKTFKYPNKI